MLVDPPVWLKDVIVPVVIELDTLDGADIPPEFVAVTVNVYDVVEANPVTLIGVVEFVPVKLSGLLIAVYVVIVPFPPLGVKATLYRLKLYRLKLYRHIFYYNLVIFVLFFITN